jgi:hypothetical protein
MTLVGAMITIYQSEKISYDFRQDKKWPLLYIKYSWFEIFLFFLIFYSWPGPVSF